MAVNGRGNKPRCESCSHPISFHGTDFERCHALGCSCSGYAGLTYLGVSTLSAEEAAERLGVSADWLVRHGIESGGVRHESGDIRVERGARGQRLKGRGFEWRFEADVIDGLVAAQADDEEAVAHSK